MLEFNGCRRQLGGSRLGSNKWLDSGRERTQILVLAALVCHVEQPVQIGQAQI